MKIHFNKPPLPVEEQVKLLQSRGLIVPDSQRASRYLLSIGYYRFSAYCIPFEYCRGEIHQFNANVNFDDVLELYIFDRKLLVNLDYLFRSSYMSV